MRTVASRIISSAARPTFLSASGASQEPTTATHAVCLCFTFMLYIKIVAAAAFTSGEVMSLAQIVLRELPLPRGQRKRRTPQQRDNDVTT